MGSPLHDWRLWTIEFDLQKRQAHLLLSSSPENSHTLIATNIRHIDIPQRYEWGRSIWILSAEMQCDGPDDATVSIQMQSDDKIIIVAQAFSFDGEAMTELPTRAAENVWAIPMSIGEPRSL